MKYLGTTASEVTHYGTVVIDKDSEGVVAGNATALDIYFDRTVPGSGTEVHNDRGIDLNVNSASLGTSSLYGIDIDVVGTASGNSTAYGIHLDVSGADTNYGIVVASLDRQLQLAYNALQYATFTVSNTGDLTIATVGSGTTDSDMTLDPDGKLVITPASITGTAVHVDANGAAGSVVDIDAGILDIDVTGAATLNSTTLDIVNSSVSTWIARDLSIISRAAGAATAGADLKLVSDDVDAAIVENDRLGVVTFLGAEDGASTLGVGAKIEAFAEEHFSASEHATRLIFSTTNGTDTTEALRIDKNNLATFAGAVTIAGALTCTTDLATDQQKHLAYFELAGYTTADGNSFMFADIMSGNKAPFLHDDTSLGADGLTAVAPSLLLRMAGTVMPRAGVLKLWKGWGASASTSATVSVSIFKYTPTADDSDDDALVVVKNTDFGANGGANLKTWAETSFPVAFAAGDILITGIKGTVNNKAAYFTSTIEVEWT